MNLVFNNGVQQNGVYYLCCWLFLAVLIHSLYLSIFSFFLAQIAEEKIQGHLKRKQMLRVVVLNAAHLTVF
jgi:hypothetical protein